MNRRHWMQRTAVAGFSLLSRGVSSSAMSNTILKRRIPSTGEEIPVIGLGTWQTFDVTNDEAELQPLRDVLKLMIENGSTLIDSSPMYGRSQAVVRTLSASLGLNSKFFIATKVWTNGEEAGRNQMNNSFKELNRRVVDLMQVHNLVDWKTHLKTLQQMKEEGKIRYIGLTHYLDSAHRTIEDIIANHSVDFIQINYSIISRNAEKRLLDAAADHNVAVIVNRPFEKGELFSRVKEKRLPAWAHDFDCHSWAQFFLKFILSNPHATCVIPGTSKTKHLINNLGAGCGALPDKATRQKMIDLIG
jgi:diketogulonate reductase-like aldo/keto reductase